MLRAIATPFLFLGVVLVSTGSSFGVNGAESMPCNDPQPCYQAAHLMRNPLQGTPDLILAEVDRLKVVQQEHPGSLWAKRAGLRIGLLLLAHDPAEALPYLRSGQRDFPLLQDYVRLWTGKAMSRLNRPVVAAVFFESIPEVVTDTLLTTRAAYGAGEAWYQGDRCDRAAPLLTQAVAAEPDHPNATLALLHLADCQIRAHQQELAIATLKELWIRYPQTQEAQEGSRKLAEQTENGEWRPSPDERFRRAMMLMQLSLNAEAVDELDRFLAEAPDHSQREAAELKLGTALVRVKRYDRARQVFERLATGGGRSADEATGWLLRVAIRQEDHGKVRELDQALPRLVLSNNQRASMLMYLGVWWEDRGKPEEAIVRYQQAARVAESSGDRVEALWRIGWLHYRQGEFQGAERLFRDAAKIPGGEDAVPQLLYWTARAMGRQGRDDARSVYERVCRDFPYTYYCQLAHTRIHQAELQTGLQTEASAHPASAAPSEETAASPAEALAEKPAGESAEAENPDPMPDIRLSRDVHYLRAIELKLLGLEEEAAQELIALRETAGRDRQSVAYLSGLFHDVGAYHQALRLARLYFRQPLERGGGEVPDALWHAAYPTGYLLTIQEHAGGLLDPYLAAAVIREESHYDTRAVSYVGAVGLMQLMPSTARAVARQLGVVGVQREDLFDHDLNIRFGVTYLAQLLRRFSGNVLYAIAAYNAGPPAVSAWIREFGDKDPDEFVERIPYRETRAYVKRVLRSYREYHRVDGNGCASGFLDKPC